MRCKEKERTKKQITTKNRIKIKNKFYKKRREKTYSFIETEKF